MPRAHGCAGAAPAKYRKKAPQITQITQIRAKMNYVGGASYRHGQNLCNLCNLWIIKLCQSSESQSLVE